MTQVSTGQAAAGMCNPNPHQIPNARIADPVPPEEPLANTLNQCGEIASSVLAQTRCVLGDDGAQCGDSPATSVRAMANILLVDLQAIDRGLNEIREKLGPANCI